MILSGKKEDKRIYKVHHISKKAYFFRKKHGKDKPEINNIAYLQMVGWNRMKGIKEESTLFCTYLLV